MNFVQPHLRVGALSLLASLVAAGARELTPREAYNQGTDALEENHLREAESWFRRAVESQRESLQPPALYNLGHVRFRQGNELLKGESARQPMLDRADSAAEEGGDAVTNADRALQGSDVMTLLEAYMNGRASRKQLRLANEDVQRALDLFGSVLVRWRRSVGDFRSSNELVANDTAAKNAKTVERHIEELLKHMKELEGKKDALKGMRQQLKQKMAELRKRIPDGMIQPGQGEGDEEEEEEKGQPKPESGWQDRGGPQGEERGITPEIAQQILEALGINGSRKLPLGGDEKTKPRDKNAKDW